MRYRDLGPIVEAFQFGFDKTPDWFIEHVLPEGEEATERNQVENYRGVLLANTYGGQKIIKPGDYATQDTDGDIIIWKKAEFESRYQRLEE
jgi:hypothetical protein